MAHRALVIGHVIRVRCTGCGHEWSTRLTQKERPYRCPSCFTNLVYKNDDDAKPQRTRQAS